MAFDYKKEYKDLYMPKATPAVVEVPGMKFIAVDGSGNPNDPDGEYQRALGILFPVAYTLKMSHKTNHSIDGFFGYVVPPLEGLWWTDNGAIDDFSDKSSFRWTAMICIPDFVKADDVGRHHEIYLSDPRKCQLEKMKTVLRIPIAERK